MKINKFVNHMNEVVPKKVSDIAPKAGELSSKYSDLGDALLAETTSALCMKAQIMKQVSRKNIIPENITDPKDISKFLANL